MAGQKKRAAVDSALCVACGCCVKVCPKGAVSIDHGRYAYIDLKQCVGCGLCLKECPASVITLEVSP